MQSEELDLMMARLDASLRALAESRDRLGAALGAALHDLKTQMDTIECVPEQRDDKGIRRKRFAASSLSARDF